MGRNRCGFSVIELVITLAILAILLAVGFVSLPSGGATAFANDLRALIQQARFEAVKQNTVVAVVWRPAEREFQARLGEPDNRCGGAVILANRSLDEYPRIAIETTFPDNEGIVWLPNGQARSCALGSFERRIATVSDSRSERTVTVTVTGRITIE